MKETLEKFLLYYSPSISKENIALFTSITKYKKFSKGDVIVPCGKLPSKFYILDTGCVGAYIENQKDSKKFIRTLYTSGKLFGGLSSLIEKSKSNASFNSLTNCNVHETDFNAFLDLKEKNKEFSLLYNNLLEYVFLKSERKIDEICLLTSTQRYLKLMQDIPNITNMLPQYQIAYYLNITPVQLSRIRKKLLSS